MARRVLELLGDRDRAAAIGRSGRELVIARWSVARMVEGYQELIKEIYTAKSEARNPKLEVRTMRDAAEALSSWTLSPEVRISSFGFRIFARPPLAVGLGVGGERGYDGTLTGGGAWTRI